MIEEERRTVWDFFIESESGGWVGWFYLFIIGYAMSNPTSK